MRDLDLDAFLALGWSPTVRIKLRQMADDPTIQLLVGWDNAGRLSASAFTGEPESWPAGTLAIWRRPTTVPTVPLPKTRQALELIAQGLTPNAAARQVGLDPAAVYRAQARARDRPICPCCGQVVREGFTVKIPSPDSTSA